MGQHGWEGSYLGLLVYVKQPYKGAFGLLPVYAHSNACVMFVTGTLPGGWLAAAYNLTSVNLGFNRLSGVSACTQKQSMAFYSLGEVFLSEGKSRSLSSGRVTGTVPPAWLLQLTAPSANLSRLDLACNDLYGGLPSSAAVGGLSTSNHSVGTVANVTLVPMNAGFELCGPVPDGINAVSLTGKRIPRILPAGPCPMAAVTGESVCYVLKLLLCRR